MAPRLTKPAAAPKPPPIDITNWFAPPGVVKGSDQTQTKPSEGTLQSPTAAAEGVKAAEQADLGGGGLKKSLVASVPEMGKMVLSMPKGLGNFFGSFVGLGLGQPSPFAKEHGLGWAQNVPLVGFGLSKAGTEMAKSMKATATDIYRIGKPGITVRSDPATGKVTMTQPKNVDRITQAVREGRPIAGLIIEDFGNVAMVGGAFKRGFQIQESVNAVKSMKAAAAAGEANAAGAAEEAAAQAAKSAGYAEAAARARVRKEAARTFEHGAARVAAAPMYPYTYAYKFGRTYSGEAGRWWADRLRSQADALDAAGDQSNLATVKRNKADRYNRIFGTPLRDPQGNPVLDEKGNPVIAERAGITQWAKDRLRRIEARISKLHREGINIFQKPLFHEDINPDTNQPYGPLTPDEEAAVFAIRNGRSTLLRFMQDALPDFSLEKIVEMGSRSRHEGYSLTDEGARLAVAYERGTLDMKQYQRLATAVNQLDTFIETYMSEPRRQGEGTVYRDKKTNQLKRDALDPYQDLPVPELGKLQRALRNSPAQDIADVLDRLIELGLADLPVGDVNRLNMIRAIVNAAPDSVVGDLSIWPAKERNRVAEVMAVREALGQMGVQEVIGTPPPEGGPGAVVQPLKEDPVTGLPTVEDIVAQRMPGELPKYSASYMRRSIEALTKLRGRSAKLAKQIMDSMVAQDAAERHIINLRLQLKEIEGFFLNRLNREVFPNAKGELPKSARRIPGTLEEARRVRDEQLALYEEMVRAQQEAVVVDGVQIDRETVASNVEELSKGISAAENVINAIDQAGGELVDLMSTLSDHEAKAAAQLAESGVDPQIIRDAVQQDLVDLPDNPSMPMSFGRGFAQLDAIVEIRRNAERAFSDTQRKQANVEYALRPFDRQANAVERDHAAGRITEEQYLAAIDEINTQSLELRSELDRLDQLRNDQYDALQQLNGEIISVFENAAVKLIGVNVDEAVRLLEGVKSSFQLQNDLLNADKEIQDNLQSKLEDIYNQHYEITDDSTDLIHARNAAQTPKNERVIEVIDGDPANLITPNNNWGHVEIKYSGITYEIWVDKVGSGKKRGVSVSIDRIVDPNAVDLVGDPVQPYDRKPGRQVVSSPKDAAALGKAFETPGFDLITNPELLSVLEQDRVQLAKKWTSAAQKKLAELEQQLSELKNTYNAVDELDNKITEQINFGIGKDTFLARVHQAIETKIKEAMVGKGKLKAAAKTAKVPKLSKTAESVLQIENQIAFIDAALNHFEKTGNWMGNVLGIADPILGADVITNIAGSTIPILSDIFNMSDTPSAIEMRDKALALREELVTQAEQMVAGASPGTVSDIAKTSAVLNQQTQIDPTDPKSWTEIEKGVRQIQTGTRTYELREEPRPGGTAKQKNFTLKRIASDGLPIESTGQVFKTFAAARKYVADTIRIDAEVANNHDVPYPRLMLEAPKTPPFPQDLIDAEARLAKVEGKRVSLIRDLNTQQKRLLKMRVEDAKRRTLLPRVTSAQNRLEARLGREVLTQPGATEVNGQPASFDPSINAYVRPTERLQRQMADVADGVDAATQAEMQVVAASLNEANFARRQAVPIQMAMEAAMSRPRVQVTDVNGEPRFAQGSGYVPNRGPRTGQRGPQRTYEEGLTGRRLLSSQRFRTGKFEEIYNMRDLIKTVVSENRQMNQNEAIVALMSSQFAMTAADMLGADKIKQIQDDAYSYALNDIKAFAPGRIDRDAYFQRQYEQRVGEMIRTEMSNRGWETNPGEYSNMEGSRPDIFINEGTRFLPRYVREAVLRRTTFVDPTAFNMVQRFIQKGTTTFKNLTLPISLTWQLGDIASTFILSAMTDVPIKDLIQMMQVAYDQNYGGGIKQIFKPEEQRTVGKIGQYISESGLQDVGLRLEERAALEGYQVTPRGGVLSKVPVLGAVPRAYGSFREAAYRFNEFTNRIGRQAYFLTKLQQKLDEYNAGPERIGKKPVTMEMIVDQKLDVTEPEIGKLFWDSVNQANDVLGDWMDLSPFERRHVMPIFTFYAWVKHINKLMFNIAVNDPAKVMWYMYLGNMAYDQNSDPFGLWTGWIPSPFGGFTRADWANPAADVINGPAGLALQALVGGDVTQSPVGALTSMISPVPRLGFSALTGQSLKTGFNELQRPPYAQQYTATGKKQTSFFQPIRHPSELLGMAIDTFPLLRKMADLAPTGEIPGTNVQLGPYKTYETGYARTVPGTTLKVEKPGGRAGALLSLVNFPFRQQKSAQQFNEEQIQAIKQLAAAQRRQARYQATGG